MGSSTPGRLGLVAGFHVDDQIADRARRSIHYVEIGLDVVVARSVAGAADVAELGRRLVNECLVGEPERVGVYEVVESRIEVLIGEIGEVQEIVVRAIDVADALDGERIGAGGRIGAEENLGEDEIDVGLLQSHDATPRETDC